MGAKHVKIEVRGFVQGVGFRYYARTKAQELGLFGIACNEPDGSVYLEIEGPEEKIDNFLKWCHDGPSAAKVESVELNVKEPVGYTDFKIF
jgi:acylphosphatase